MSESGYLVSQASKLLEVQSHVLRYWEEELLLPIGRNELGHRYYTRYDIQVILCIKELKKKGFSLKEIKKVIPLFYETVKQEETNSKGDDLEREVLEKANSQRISEIKNLNMTDSIGQEITVGNVDSNKLKKNEQNIVLEYIDKEAWEKQIKPAVGDIKGSYPEKENEIMLSQSVIDLLKLKNKRLT